MTILSKVCKPDKFESHNSLKLSFTNIWCLCSNFADCESFLECCFVWDKLGWLNWFWQLLCERLSSPNSKRFWYSYAWSRSLCEGRTSFYTRPISRKFCKFLFMFSAGFTLLNILFLFPLVITFFNFVHSFWFCFIKHR